MSLDINPGDHVQTREQFVGSKRNVYAEQGDLLTVINLNHYPVAAVHIYGKESNSFFINLEKVTKDLSQKNKQRIDKDIKAADAQKKKDAAKII